ncbi:MAG: ABC transporter substrate-binding protein [Actinomycetota bacterium]|nr:ABC transporter substrate-binding protein [Actinomycetota bacterium]
MKRVAAVVLLALGLAACGEKRETITPTAAHPQALTLMLDWVPNADHVGIFQALEEGDFTRAALNVHVQTPSDPASPLELLAAGRVDVAISYEPEVLLARNRGIPVVSVAAIVQQPLTSIVSVGSAHIGKVSDLRGKKVGDAGIPYQHAYLETVLAHAGVPPSSVTEINVGANLVPAMLSRRVSATLGAYWNYEAIQLALDHKKPHVIRMEQVGVPTYDELVVAVRKSTLIEHPDEIRRFVQALARGYESARQNPQGAVRNLVSANPDAGLDPKLQLASVQATLSAFFPSNPAEPWGWQDPAEWNAYGAWMLREHLISNPNAAIAASTNELLAGRGI